MSPRAPLVALALGVVLAGCGGDDEEESAGPALSTPTVSPSTPTVTQPPGETTTGDEAEPAQTETEPEAQTSTAPPEDEGGDEEPIRTDAALEGSGGKIRPRTVQVPAFIAVRVTLRSTDGRPYALRVGGKLLAVDVEKPRASALLPGIRPGRTYPVRALQGGAVKISATAEPGP